MNQAFKIAVCGSNAKGLPEKYNGYAYSIGEEIAKQNAILFTGATTGFSLEAVKGAYKHKGNIIGISPAESKQEQLERYEKINFNLWTSIIYTGVGYKMRDVVMIRSVDAAIYVGGGVGTLLEMASAVDYGRIMGILVGSGGATNLYKQVDEISHRKKPIYVLSEDPVELVDKVIKKLKE